MAFELHGTVWFGAAVFAFGERLLDRFLGAGYPSPKKVTFSVMVGLYLFIPKVTYSATKVSESRKTECDLGGLGLKSSLEPRRDSRPLRQFSAYFVDLRV